MVRRESGLEMLWAGFSYNANCKFHSKTNMLRSKSHKSRIRDGK